MKKSSTEQLTFTRFISAFAILWVHFESGTAFYIPRVDKILFPFFPVTYFFVLSGFVLGIAYHDRFEKDSDKHVSFKKYYLLRIARIYPVYLLALAAQLYYLWNYRPLEIPSLKTLILNITLMQSWFIIKTINFPSWSLSCEVFYYMLFPLILHKVKKLDNKQIITSMVIIWIMQQVIFYVLFDYYNAELGIKFHPVLHLPTFVSGVLLAVFYRRTTDVLGEMLASYSNILIVFVLANVFFNKSIFEFETLQLPFFLCFIYLVCMPNNFYANNFRGKIFMNLGFISYGIYILQIPVAVYSNLIFDRLHILNPNNRFILFIVAIMITSTITYFFYEKPIYKKISSYLK